jgi:hypothetical protein
MTKSELLNMLQEDIVVLDFEKVDGTTRTMHATLNGSYVQYNEAPSNQKKSTQAQPVWDTHAEGWRSFRWTSVSSVNGSPVSLVIDN